MKEDKPKTKRFFRLCEYSEAQEQFIKVRMETAGLSYSSLARIAMDCLMRQYRVDVPEKKAGTN